jgi:DNA invertase Pin-like site-specific DNA recombinase
MARDVSTAYYRALAQRDHDRLAELAQLAKQVRKNELSLQVARGRLDARLYHWHEDGIPIAALARAANISRHTVYKAIDRYRGQRA